MYFKVLAGLFLGEVSSVFLPSKKACWAHKFRHVGVGQQYRVSLRDLCIQKSQEISVFRDSTFCLHCGVWGIDCVSRQVYNDPVMAWCGYSSNQRYWIAAYNLRSN